MKKRLAVLLFFLTFFFLVLPNDSFALSECNEGCSSDSDCATGYCLDAGWYGSWCRNRNCPDEGNSYSDCVCQAEVDLSCSGLVITRGGQPLPEDNNGALLVEKGDTVHIAANVNTDRGLIAKAKVDNVGDRCVEGDYCEHIAKNTNNTDFTFDETGLYVFEVNTHSAGCQYACTVGGNIYENPTDDPVNNCYTRLGWHRREDLNSACHNNCKEYVRVQEQSTPNATWDITDIVVYLGPDIVHDGPPPVPTATPTLVPTVIPTPTLSPTIIPTPTLIPTVTPKPTLSPQSTATWDISNITVYLGPNTVHPSPPPPPVSNAEKDRVRFTIGDYPEENLACNNLTFNGQTGDIQVEVGDRVQMQAQVSAGLSGMAIAAVEEKGQRCTDGECRFIRSARGQGVISQTFKFEEPGTYAVEVNSYTTNGEYVCSTGRHYYQNEDVAAGALESESWRQIANCGQEESSVCQYCQNGPQCRGYIIVGDGRTHGSSGHFEEKIARLFEWAKRRLG